MQNRAGNLPRYEKRLRLSKLCQIEVEIRVATWFVFKPKIPVLVNFGRP
jgi:hypothetical protein